MNFYSALLSGLFGLFISFTSGAQTGSPGGKSLLWQISGNKLAHPSYLFGTIHLICTDDYVWTKSMEESFNKSDKICFEMDLDDPEVVAKITTGLADKSGKKLPDYFTPEQYIILRTYVKDSLGLDIKLFENLKPIALQSIIGASGLNCTNPISYEDSMLKNALLSGKEIMGLEEPEEQISLLDSIPADTVVKQLLDDIQHTQRSDSEYTQLVNAYKSQDLPKLYELITASNELGTDMGIFLDNRNKKWISRIRLRLESGTVFFAVGAGHLWGDWGIIHLLRQAGYTVQPL